VRSIQTQQEDDADPEQERRSFFSHPMAVQIIGGTVAGVVTIGIVYLIGIVF
jgi:hypothetical protein